MAKKKTALNGEGVAETFTPKSRVFDLIAKNSPPEKVFKIRLPKADVMEFKNFESLSAIAECHAAAEIFADQIEANAKNIPNIAHLSALTKHDLKACFILAQMSTEFDVGEIMEIAGANPNLLRYITKAVDAACYGDESVLVMQEVAAAKKDSEPQSVTETESS